VCAGCRLSAFVLFSPVQAISIILLWLANINAILAHLYFTFVFLLQTENGETANDVGRIERARGGGRYGSKDTHCSC